MKHTAISQSAITRLAVVTLLKCTSCSKSAAFTWNAGVLARYCSHGKQTNVPVRFDGILAFRHSHSHDPPHLLHSHMRPRSAAAGVLAAAAWQGTHSRSTVEKMCAGWHVTTGRRKEGYTATGASAMQVKRPEAGSMEGTVSPTHRQSHSE